MTGPKPSGPTHPTPTGPGPQRDDLMALADAIFELPNSRVPLVFGTAPTPTPTGPINPPPHPPPPGRP